MNKNKIFLKMAIGFIAGIISGLFSTGGGMILVPAFIYLLKIKDIKARGTSIFCILIGSKVGELKSISVKPNVLY